MVAKLIVASGKSAGRSIALKHGKLLIGRADECDIRPLGDEVSRRHCEVRVDGDALTVEDLKSRNGTYVNGTKIAAKTRVTDGDIIRVGPIELRVSVVAPNAPANADDVSRWLMADDEPAGMFDTTRTVISGGHEPAPGEPVPGESAAEPQPAAVAADQAAGAGSETPVGSGIEALIAAKGKPGALPADMRGPKTVNSKDAASEALRKFFGKR